MTLRTETSQTCPHCGGRSFRHGERNAAALDVERLAAAMMEALTPGYRSGSGSKGYKKLHHQRAERIAAAYARLAAESALRVDPHRFVDGVCPTCHYSDRFSHMTAHDARLAAEPKQWDAGGDLGDRPGSGNTHPAHNPRSGKLVDAAEVMRQKYNEAVEKHGNDNPVLKDLRWAIGHLAVTREIVLADKNGLAAEPSE